MRLDFIRQLRSADWILILATFTLVSFGLAAIYSVELSRGTTDFLNIQKQGAAAVIGATLFLMVACSNYHLLRNYAVVLYATGLALLGGVLLGLFYNHGRQGGPPFDTTEADVKSRFSSFDFERFVRAPDSFPGRSGEE